MEKKEYNDIDSLAAFLHSSEEENKNKKTISSSDYEELMNSSKSESDVDSILFSLDSKKKKPKNAAPSLDDAVSEPEYDEGLGEEGLGEEGLGDEGFGDEEIDMSGLDDEDYADEEAHYNDGATRTMAAIRSTGTSRYSEQEYEEEYDEEDTPASRAEMRREAELKRRYERQRQTTRTFAYLLTAIFLCIIVVGASAIASKYLVDWALDLTGIGTNEFSVEIEIPDNADLDTVAAVLSENNIISSPRFFKFFTELSDKLDEDEDGDGVKDEPKSFIGGTYTVSSNMSYSTLVRLMRTEAVVKKTITLRITEGMTAREIGLLLEENNVCYADDFEKYYQDVLNKYDFERRVKENPLKFNQLEGYLFPDTYEFYINNDMEAGKKTDTSENAEEAAMKMYSNFNDKMTRQMYKKMGEMNMTLDEVMAIASLVQREAAYAEDMKFVASVFLNRIRNSEEFPYLQSDVSIIYVENDIKPYISGTLAEKEKIYDAYNTYVCTGIPSGAVCNPGLDAINAVLDAAETDYYYFCANEETGEIYYAKTIEEHEKNLLLAEIKKEEGNNS